jgi:hypothetical protein
MRRITRGVAGILLGCAFTGCGETPSADEAVRIQPSNSEQFNSVKPQLAKGVLSEVNAKKPADMKPVTPAPADAKAAETKPVTPAAATAAPAETKPATPAAPAVPKPTDPKTPEKKP